MRIGYNLSKDAQICRVYSGSIEHEEAPYLCQGTYGCERIIDINAPILMIAA